MKIFYFRHIQILSGTEGVALNVQIVLNNIPDDSDKPDIDVTVKGGGLRIFFLNWFVANMLVCTEINILKVLLNIIFIFRIS